MTKPSGSTSAGFSLHSVPGAEPATPVEPLAEVDPAMPSPGLPVPKPDIEPPAQIPDRDAGTAPLPLTTRTLTMLAKPLSMIIAAMFCAGGALAQQTSTPASPSADASGPKAGAPEKMKGSAHMKHDKGMKSTDKAGKPPVDDAASQPTAKKPAKKGAQSGPAASQ